VWATELIHLAAVALGRAARAAIANCEQRMSFVALGRSRAVVVEAIGGDCGADTLRDRPADLHDSFALVDPRFDTIADLHHRCRLGNLAVDLDVPAPACGRGIDSRLADPDRR
jgi:hypothetical protein